jgi:hypothetical protein
MYAQVREAGNLLYQGKLDNGQQELLKREMLERRKQQREFYVSMGPLGSLISHVWVACGVQHDELYSRNLCAVHPCILLCGALFQ